jgi:hypothetical protein
VRIPEFRSEDWRLDSYFTWCGDRLQISGTVSDGFFARSGNETSRRGIISRTARGMRAPPAPQRSHYTIARHRGGEIDEDRRSFGGSTRFWPAFPINSDSYVLHGPRESSGSLANFVVCERVLLWSSVHIDCGPAWIPLHHHIHHIAKWWTQGLHRLRIAIRGSALYQCPFGNSQE